MAYLKVEKPRFLFLEGSAGAKATAVAAAVAPPDASAARTGTSAAHAGSSVDRPAAGAPAPTPGACSSAASAALDERGAGSHLSGGLPPVTFFFFFPRRRVLRRCRGRESLLLAQPELFISLLPALLAPDPALLLLRRPLLFPPLRRPLLFLPLRRARVPGLGVWAGQTARRSRPPSAREDETSKSRRQMENG
jgi:hypothetical protein